MTTQSEKRQVTLNTHRYRWRVTLYDGNVPALGPDGGTKTEASAREDVQKALERLAEKKVQAYAAIIKVSTADPMNRTHIARAELCDKTGQITWYDITPAPPAAQAG